MQAFGVNRSDKRRDALGGRTSACLIAAAGVVSGLAFREPWLWPLGWVSLVLLGAGLSGRARPWQVVLALGAGTFAGRLIGFSWLFEAVTVAFPGSLPERIGIFALAHACWALPSAVVIAGTYAALRRFSVALWLPPAWALGEWLRTLALTATIDDWLAAQWTNDGILRALGHLGWWPTLLVSVGAASALGQALAQRRPWLAAPLLAWVIILTALPPLPTAGNERLLGVAAVHTDSHVALPMPGPDTAALELVVWPEGAFRLVPQAPEGRHEVQLGLPPLLLGSSAEHLVGLDVAWGSTLQTRLVALDAAGVARSSRGKSDLFPIRERRWFGLGEDTYLPGSAKPLLTVGGRRTIPLLCHEIFHRERVQEGIALGGDLLVVAAGEGVTPSARARRQVRAVQALRSAEFGVPSVRASQSGDAAFFGADGRMLAISEDNSARGLLTWSPRSGELDLPFNPTEGATPDVAVLFSMADARYALPCPDGRCSYHVFEDFTCGSQRATSVVIGGHSRPPLFAGQPPEVVAAAVRCFEPDLIVVNSCFGATTPLLSALSDIGAVVVAAPGALPEPGLRLGADFFGVGPTAVRAAAIVAPWGVELFRGVPSVADLEAARSALLARSPVERRRALAVAEPALLAARVTGGPVLIPATPTELSMTPAQRRRSLRDRFSRARERLKRTTHPAGAPATPVRSRR